MYLVSDGSMRLHTSSGIMDYIERQYLISVIDMPNSGQVLSFSEKGDFIALAITFSPDDVISVVLDIDDDLAEQILNSEIPNYLQIYSDKEIIEIISRLLDITNKSEQLAFMGKHLKREIIFYILCGSCGKQFLQSIISNQQSGEIYEINS